MNSIVGRIEKMSILPYYPGVLPTKPPLKKGDVIAFEVDGYPPYKDEAFSIRNVRHRDYNRFVRLRKAGTKAMHGHAWACCGPISMEFVLYAPEFEENRQLLDYAAGIEDTLDGSSGPTFTYLPIIFEDDCQICNAKVSFAESNKIKYKLRFKIL